MRRIAHTGRPSKGKPRNLSVAIACIARTGRPKKEKPRDLSIVLARRWTGRRDLLGYHNSV